MGARRRIATIVGWSAGVCAAAFLLFLGWLYLVVDDSAVTDGEDAVDAAGAAMFWFLFVSPFVGGLIGVVRSVRGATAREKVIWSLIGLVLMAVSWLVLAVAAILLLDNLPGLD